MKSFLLCILFIVAAFGLQAQSDSLREKRDTIVKKRDTTLVKKPAAKPVTKPIVVAPPAPDTTRAGAVDSTFLQLAADSLLIDSAQFDSIPAAAVKPKKFTGIDSFYAHFLQNPFLPMDKKPVYQIAQYRNRQDKDQLFYLLAGIVFYLACIRLVFGMYYTNMFRLFFQPAFRQKQTREQLMQNNLPSLLFNLFFVVSAGAYVALIVQYKGLAQMGFWKLFAYSAIAIAVVYIGKYLFISFSGWVFNAKEAAGTYVFVVYLINKIIGVLLVPFILVVAFSKPEIINVSLTIAAIFVSVLFAYRYIVSYGPVARELKVNAFHFVLYILAFEVLPLLFIYKSLILYMDRTL